MPELPSGTVTFLFSDIEGSTPIAREQGERWPGLLERHRQLMRGAFEAHGGMEIATEGDSFFVVFENAPAAVRAAADAQRALAGEEWPEGAEIRVRIGLHSGQAEVEPASERRQPTYVGVEVHRAARVVAAGHGGQVLVSDATRALVARSLPDGIQLRDLGEHRLRGLPASERLWQLVIDGLPSDFPALPTAAGTPNNLPTARTSFLGREREIAEVGQLLAQARLVTLTGPGGTGKTRLSQEVAAAGMSRYPDGVWFVELGAIREPELVPATIAQTLALPDRGGRDPVRRLVDHVGQKRMLLVLDNFEQVVDAAPTVGQLLAGAPNLRILVTSRTLLRVYGEQEYPVPPLGVPDPRRLPNVEVLERYEAVALFVERATAVKPDFRITPENAAAVAEICVRLDGLPLAIELAAARIRLLTPQAMLARLDRRLALLSGVGARDLPERQQTLRGAIAWSHEMLGDTDRSLFTCLSVFVGSAGLAAIERVCAEHVDGEILDALESLTDKSLLRQQEGLAGEARFAMLETIREFAVEQAMAGGRWEALRTAHGMLFLEMAETIGPLAMTSDKRRALDALEQDHDNLRAAMTWAIETGRAEAAMRVGAALWRFWQMRGHLVEGLERAQAALDLPGAAEHPAARADALDAAAGLAYWLADNLRSRALYEAEVEQRRALGDRPGLANALYGLSFTYSILDVVQPADAAVATSLTAQALEIYEELGDRGGVARCLWAMSNVDWATGDDDGALDKASRALEIFRAIEDRFMFGWASYTAALAHLQRDRAQSSPAERDAASRRLTDALDIFAEADDVTGYTIVLDGMALLALHEGDTQRAARLSGAVSALERTTGTKLNAPNRTVLGFEPDRLRVDENTAAAWAEGERMTIADAVAYALEPRTGEARVAV